MGQSSRDDLALKRKLSEGHCAELQLIAPHCNKAMPEGQSEHCDGGMKKELQGHASKSI